MKPFLCVANWKAQCTPDGETLLAQDIHTVLQRRPADNVEVVLAPSFLSLSSIACSVDHPLSLAAQNCFWQAAGPATGEITPPALAQMGCRYVIIGHSERRTLMNETDAMVAQKYALLLKTQKSLGLIPIVCVGETASERKQGKTRMVLDAQLSTIFSSVSVTSAHRVVIAYEPVWAISTNAKGSTKQGCSPTDCADAGEMIHTIVNRFVPKTISEPIVRVIYGGSVDAKNAASYVQKGNMDGVLVGNASLQTKSFCAIVHALNNAL